MAEEITAWQEFASYTNFLLAWQRTVNVSSRTILDELGMQVFGYNLQANLEDLLARVQASDFPYEPLADHKVYVPKPSSTLRTMSLMSVPDLVVYQALVNVIADRSHRDLVAHEDQHVMGNIYAGPGKRWTLKSWKSQYRQFVKRIESIYREDNTWMASTDIVAFYDTVDHERLLCVVRKYCQNDSRFEDLLRQCLSKWSAHNPRATISRGIPQGTNASDFLANLYLHDIDCEMILHGYHYLRYVDDVRILGVDRSTVQHGLILFDLELKRAGLVAQVAKTSVHKIEDIEHEVTRLSFHITDPTGMGGGSYRLVSIPSSSWGEQAESAANYVRDTLAEEVHSQLDLSNDDRDDRTDRGITELEIDMRADDVSQAELRDRFSKAYAQLEDPVLGKSSESSLTYCLYRLEPHESIRDLIINLIPKLPWRSEALAVCLSRFVGDRYVAEQLERFVAEHDVYSWHRAMMLWTLYNVVGPKAVATICRKWLADAQLDWYARVVAARILRLVPAQHAYLIERLRYEQRTATSDGEETAILRQELAYGAFLRIRSYKKQLALFDLICLDRSPLLHRLAIYLLQNPDCKVEWMDLNANYNRMSGFANLVRSLGIGPNATRPCFVAQTLRSMYHVDLSESNLLNFYGQHYDKAVKPLRESVTAYHRSPDDYVRHFHQFAHLSLLAFYEYALPTETGLIEGGYGQLIQRRVFSVKLPRGRDTWELLGSLRNRVDHPIDQKTKKHSEKILVREAEDLHKMLQVALQELCDVWFAASAPCAHAVTSTIPVAVSLS